MEYNLGGFGVNPAIPRKYGNHQPRCERPHGLPTLLFDTELKDNELKMRVDMANDAAEMLEAAGLKNVKPYDRPSSRAVGLGIHEMGTARMGKDPKTSVLNKYN